MGSQVLSSSTFSGPASPVCSSSCPRFSSRPGSWYDVYVLWLTGGLTRHALREAADGALVSKFLDNPVTNDILSNSRPLAEQGLLLSRQKDDRDERPVDNRFLQLLLSAAEEPEVGIGDFA